MTNKEKKCGKISIQSSKNESTITNRKFRGTKMSLSDREEKMNRQLKTLPNCVKI